MFTEGLCLEELSDLRYQRGKLAREFYVLRNSLGIVGNDLLGSPGLGNRELAFHYLLKRDDVLALVAECLCRLVIRSTRKDRTIETHHIQSGDLLGQRLLTRQDGAKYRDRNVAVTLGGVWLDGLDDERFFKVDRL